MTTIARINRSGQLLLKGIVYNQWAGLDDTQQLDTTYSVNDATSLDDTQEINTFLNVLMGITTQQIAITVNRLDLNGNLLTPLVTTSGTVVRLKSTGITVSAILTNQTL